MHSPLILRNAIYNFLPQVPDWFCNVGHFAGKYRFRQKSKTLYRQEEVSDCPLCGESDFTLIANQERNGFPISVVLCKNCAFMFNTPRLDATSLSDHYRRDYRDIERGNMPDIHEFMFGHQNSKGPSVWPPIAAALGHRDVATPRVVEIGCGEGGLLEWIRRNSNATVTGYELNVAAGAYGRSRGLDVRASHFGSARESFDVLILEQVLEHLHDPSAFIAMLAGAQQPGSLLYIGVPGLMESGAHYNSNFLVYLDYAHVSHFCLYTLERLVAPHGYRLVQGNETVVALFEKTETVGAARTPSRSAAEIVQYLQTEENKFHARGSHLTRNAKAYIKYILVGLLSLIRRWGGDPMFRA